jgi:glucokinase
VLARAGSDLEARMLVDETLAELAVHVANLAVLIDPARIAVGGGLMHSSELMLAALRRRVRQAVPFPPDVVAAQFVHDAALRGAVALAIDASARADVPAGAAEARRMSDVPAAREDPGKIHEKEQHP